MRHDSTLPAVMAGTLFAVAILLIVTLVIPSLHDELCETRLLVERLEERMDQHAQRQDDYLHQLRQMQQRTSELEELLSEAWKILDSWEVVRKQVTAYAPLDPQAVEGMCYEGNPYITASGETTQPGVTIAASPSIPYGTRVYIPGFGWGEVQDRGGMITTDRLDVALASRSDSFRWGRQQLFVLIEKEGE